jgi:hypothetical protein
VGRDLLGDRRRADRENRVTGADEPFHGDGVREARRALSGGRAAALARPDDLGADGIPDGGTHLAGEEEADFQMRSMREPPMILPVPSSKRTQALPLPS